MKNDERLVPVKRVFFLYVLKSLTDACWTLPIVKATITLKLNQQTKLISSSSYCNYYLHPVNVLDLCFNNIYYCIAR